MRRLADGVWMLRGFPPNAINVYLVEGVLIDAATRHAGRRILRQLEGHEVNAHALTHAHSDHQGASHELCTKLGIPFWVGERDADAAEDLAVMADRQADHWLNRLIFKRWTGPAHPVDRRLCEGDEVGSFEVSTCPATPPATSRSGAPPIGC